MGIESSYHADPFQGKDEPILAAIWFEIGTKNLI